MNTTVNIVRFIRDSVPAPLHPLQLVKRLAWPGTAYSVPAGPFKGLRCLEAGADQFSADYAKYAGTYEMELYPIIERLCDKPYDTVINVGAADGYYAVGFAMRIPQCRVIAYEARRQDLIERLAHLNGVSARVEARGLCTVEELLTVLDSPARTFLLMDVEEAELTLLDPEAIPRLRYSDILVEAHDLFVSGITAELKHRFEHTHRITEISSMPRTPMDMPTLRQRWLFRLAPRYMNALVKERPRQMSWLYMEAHSTTL